MEEPSIYERYCVNAYDRIVSFFQLRLVMDRYNTIYRELGKLAPSRPRIRPGVRWANKLTRLGGPGKFGAWVRYGGKPLPSSSSILRSRTTLSQSCSPGNWTRHAT